MRNEAQTTVNVVKTFQSLQVRRLNTLGYKSCTFEHSRNIKFTQHGSVTAASIQTETSQWKLRDSCSPEDETLWRFLQHHHEVELCALGEQVSWWLQACGDCQLIVHLCVMQPDCFSLIALMPQLFSPSRRMFPEEKLQKSLGAETVRARHQTADAVSDWLVIQEEHCSPQGLAKTTLLSAAPQRPKESVSFFNRRHHRVSLSRTSVCGEARPDLLTLNALTLAFALSSKQFALTLTPHFFTLPPKVDDDAVQRVRPQNYFILNWCVTFFIHILRYLCFNYIWNVGQ